MTNAEDDRALKREILDGIKTREAAIHSLNVRYTATTEFTPWYAEYWRDNFAGRHQMPWMRWLAKWKTRKMPVGTETCHYDLIAKDGKFAYSCLTEARPPGRRAPEQGVFDGEVFTVLQDGSQSRASRATGKELLSVLGIDQRLYGEFSTMFGAGHLSARLATTSEDAGAASAVGIPADDRSELQGLIELDASRVSRLASPEGTEDIVFRVGISHGMGRSADERSMAVQYTVDVNASKSYWPQRWETNFVYHAYQGLPEARCVDRLVELSDFTDVGGLAFPRKLEARDFQYTGPFDLKTSQWRNPVGGVTKIDTIAVEEIAINVPVDNSAFVIEFPVGTSFLDLDGNTYVVNADRSLTNLSNR